MSLTKDDELLKEIQEAVVNYRDEELVAICKEYIELGLEPDRAVFQGLIPGMLEVGRLYEEQEYFIPEMLLCAETLYAGLKIFQPLMKTDEQKIKGKILIGVVEGDIHDIGKNLVKMMLEISGYKVTDLGRDVPMKLFLETALEGDFDLICSSSMMSTTMYGIKSLIKRIKEKKPNLKVMVGGAPVSEIQAMKWQSDGYAPDAKRAVSVVQELLRTTLMIANERNK